MWAIIWASEENKELIWILLQFFTAAIAMLFYMKERKGKKNLVTLKRYVEMGLQFYDEDKRFLYIKDEKLTYFLVNEAYAHKLGVTKEDLLGKSVEDILPGELAEKLSTLDREVMETGQKIDRDVLWQGKTYRMVKFPLTLHDGHKGLGAVTEDITDAVKRREDLEKIIRRNEILIDVSTRDFKSSHEQLDYVLKKALTLTESDYGYIYLYNENDKTFILGNFVRDGVITSTRKATQQINRLDKMGLWSESVKTRKPMIYSGNDQSDEETHLKGQYKFNMMTVPVIREDQILAVIGVGNSPYGYGTMDAEELSILMNGVWNAKERREFTVELRKANYELAANKERLTLILNSSAEGIFGMDVHGDVTFINKSALVLLGYKDVSEVISRNCHDLIHHSTKEGTTVHRENCRIYESNREGIIITVEDEVFYRKDGSFFATRYSSNPKILDGVIIGSVVTFSDITERKKHEEDMLYLNYHDALTGLYNRTYLDKISIDLEQEKYLPMCVVVGDVNGLKLSNDIFGHKKGDEFLKTIAQIIKENTREDDLLFRVGGDEFYLFLRNTKEEAARSIMERISLSVRNEDFHGVRGGIALGLSVMETLENSLLNVTNNAEQEMYREKTLTKSEESTMQLKSFVEIVMNEENERAHAENIVQIAEDMGKALSLSEEDMANLRDAAYMHDIGKITEFMSKEDSSYVLSTRKEHAFIGYRILNSFAETMDLARIILSHHEKWDGTGYPKGLKGKEIPLFSRIIAVADRFERLTSIYSSTPYSAEEALAVMKKESGTKFDGSLVETLEDITNKKTVNEAG